VRHQPDAVRRVLLVDDRHLATDGVGGQDVLDLARVDVLAADHDHVVVAPEDGQPAVLVQHARGRRWTPAVQRSLSEPSV
jgi:hypothetical protein